jgi:predicted component of type VI protein secretion system
MKRWAETALARYETRLAMLVRTTPVALSCENNSLGRFSLRGEVGFRPWRKEIFAKETGLRKTSE